MTKAQRWHLRNGSAEHSRVWCLRSTKTEIKQREVRKSVVSYGTHQCTHNLEKQHSVPGMYLQKRTYAIGNCFCTKSRDQTYIQEMLRNSLWCVRSYKGCILTKWNYIFNHKRTVKVHYQHATTASTGKDPRPGPGLFQILPKFHLHTFSTGWSFSGISVLFKQWQRARAESCATPCLLLSPPRVIHLETNWESAFLKPGITYRLN